MNYPLMCALSLPLFLAWLSETCNSQFACKIIPDYITMLRYRLKSPVLKTVSNEDGLKIINIIQSAEAAMGIQLETELLLPADIVPFNRFLAQYELYSKSRKRRFLKSDQTMVEIDRNKGKLRIAIPIAD